MKKKAQASFLSSLILFSLSLLVTSVAVEALLRLKNSDMKNYDIEMWKYARQLKMPSPDPLLGHEHIPSKRATLQSVEIRLNEWGLRGESVPAGPPRGRRILFLGTSATLGWGVPENLTLTQRIAEKFRARGQRVEVLNGGVGNYNSSRYVRLFFKRLEALEPTDIVVHYSLRDAELLEPGGRNFLLQHSQLAVTAWIAWHNFAEAMGDKGMIEHYHAVYAPGAEGFGQMVKSLAELSAYAHARKIRLYLALTPEIHFLGDYPLLDVHEVVRRVAEQQGYNFFDLLPALRNHSREEIWAMPGDPHPSSFAHGLMADALFPALEI